MKENSEYNTGKAMKSSDIKEEEMSLAISDWAENNEQLENAIRACIENGIPTFASCAGHNLISNPYLSMIITKENLGQILNIMNQISKIKNSQIDISFSKDRESVLTIRGNMLNKNRCFNTVAQEAEKCINIEDTVPIVQSLWNAHRSLRTHGGNFYNNIQYLKGMINDRLVISLINENVILHDILKNNGLKRNEDAIGVKIDTATAFRTKKFIKILDAISEEVADTFIDCEDDKFFEDKRTKHQEFVDRVNEGCLEEKTVMEECYYEEKSVEEREDKEYR